MKAGLARAAVLCSEGGDWERKNRLKVYEALFALATRDFQCAAELFLDSIATFTTCATSELIHPVRLMTVYVGFGWS